MRLNSKGSIMSKFETYYKEIRQRRAELSGRFPEDACLVVAAGCVTEVTLDIAARLLTENTHSLASDDQARAFHATQAMNRTTTPLIDTLANARAQYAVLMAHKEQSK
jgi:roadblock/LC7 domain-containing protein